MSSDKLNIINNSIDNSRGVRNPKVIDLISSSKENKTVTLLLIEDREYSDVKTQLHELEEKLNNYLDYILEGYLVKDYPQYEEFKPIIKFEHIYPLADEAKQLLEAFSRFANNIQLKFQIEKTDKV